MVQAPIRTSVVHVLGQFESAIDGVSVRRCTNCGEAMFFRFPGDGMPWHNQGDHIRVHGGGQRERTHGPATCERTAAA